MPVARKSVMVLGQLKMTMTRWRKLLETVRDPYRPERHYMRGPGPKWHAKHHTLHQNGVL
ncbi:hypothetical protein ACH79_26135 [Bradyrhizobium sp. CCBAU 051011]|nr:hypothetical protein ACH79_26135 [Bradyrhizobium sp. CCBAU 051011]